MSKAEHSPGSWRWGWWKFLFKEQADYEFRPMPEAEGFAEANMVLAHCPYGQRIAGFELGDHYEVLSSYCLGDGEGSSIAAEESTMRLIAAAPDLLEACKNVLESNYLGDFKGVPVFGSTTMDVLEQVRNAIAKATGEEKQKKC